MDAKLPEVTLMDENNIMQNASLNTIIFVPEVCHCLIGEFPVAIVPLFLIEKYFFRGRRKQDNV